jgi:hypothetical protein
MIWLILVIIVVGFFVVMAINRNTENNAIIARQQYLDSTEYKKQAQADMAYWRYASDVLDYKIWIAEAEKESYYLPDTFTGVTYSKDYKRTSKPKKYSKKEIIEGNKIHIKNLKEQLEAIKKEYEERKKEYKGYYPASIETIRDKYDMASPFPPSDDGSFLNEDNASSWSMYEDRINRLKRLQYELSNLKKGIDIKKLTLNEAIKIVKEENRANISLFKSRLHIDYREAKDVMNQLEENGIIGSSKGSQPREVL